MFKSWARQLLRPVVAELINERGLGGARTRLDSLEERMAQIEDEAYSQLGTLIGVVVAEVASLRDGVAQKDQALADAKALIDSQAGQLAGAEADKAAAVSAAVSAALDADSQADAARVEQYVDQLKAAVPDADVPDVPVPDPGQPAEPPADSGVDVPVVDPTPTPDPTPVDGGDADGGDADGGTVETDEPVSGDDSANS